MRRLYFLLAIFLLEVVGGNPAVGQEGPVVERLIRLEEGHAYSGENDHLFRAESYHLSERSDAGWLN